MKIPIYSTSVYVSSKDYFFSEYFDTETVLMAFKLQYFIFVFCLVNVCAWPQTEKSDGSTVRNLYDMASKVISIN